MIHLFYDVKLNKKDTQIGGLDTKSSGDLDTYNINITSKKTEVNSQIKSVDNRGTFNSDTGAGIANEYIVFQEPKFEPTQQEKQTFLSDLENKETIRLGKLPSVYINLNWENADVKTNKSVILKDTEIKHNVPMEVVRRLPELYSDPLLVFESATQKDRLVAVIDAKDNSGRQIVVALSPNTQGMNGYHFIPSFYGKTNFDKFIEKNVNAGRLRYVRDNQVSDSLQLWTQALGYIDNIKQKSDIVNSQIKSIYNRGTFSSDTGAGIANEYIVFQEPKFEPTQQEKQTFLSDLENKETIRLGKLPSVYQNIGIESADVKTKQTVIEKATINKHAVPIEVVKQLPELFANPQIVFKSLNSSTNPNAYVAVVDAFDKDGKQMIIALSPTSKSGGYHLITSFYGRDNIQNMINNAVKEDKIKYVRDKNIDLLAGHNAYLSQVGNSIKYKDNIVNSQIKSVDNRGTFSSDTGNIFYQSDLCVQRMRPILPMYQQTL